MTQTELANLALDLLGEPYLTSYDSDTGTTAEAVRLHYPVALKSLLESHPWSFATACSQLTAASLDETYATVTLSPAGDNNDILFTAVTPGPSGNDIAITITASASTYSQVTVDASAISINAFSKAVLTVGGTLLDWDGYPLNPPLLVHNNTDLGWYDPALGGSSVVNNGTGWTLTIVGAAENYWTSNNVEETDPTAIDDWTPLSTNSGTPTITAAPPPASNIITLINDNPSAAALVTAENSPSSDGTGAVAAVTSTNLAGGSSTATVYAPAYGSAFNLPDDCVRLLKIDDVDIDAPRNRFEIQGRHLLLEETNAEAPVIHYIQANPPIEDWPSTFTDAFVTLLAHRLSAKLCQNDNLKQSLRNDHQLALAQARNKDARETRSKENHGPRALAARSGLVAARFTRTAQPPYSAS